MHIILCHLQCQNQTQACIIRPYFKSLGSNPKSPTWLRLESLPQLSITVSTSIQGLLKAFIHITGLPLAYFTIKRELLNGVDSQQRCAIKIQPSDRNGLDMPVLEQFHVPGLSFKPFSQASIVSVASKQFKRVKPEGSIQASR